MEVTGFNTRFRIIAIDPGTEFLGMCVIDIDLVTLKAHVIFSETICGGSFVKKYKRISELHNKPTARLKGYGEYFDGALDKWQPHAVIAESPFLGKFPQAFARLTECLYVIRQSMVNYNKSVPFYTVDPPSAKKSVGVIAKGSSKDDIARAVIKLDGVIYETGVLVSNMTEHESDSVAVGYYLYRAILEGEFPTKPSKKKKKRKQSNDDVDLAFAGIKPSKRTKKKRRRKKKER